MITTVSSVHLLSVTFQLSSGSGFCDLNQINQFIVLQQLLEVKCPDDTNSSRKLRSFATFKTNELNIVSDHYIITLLLHECSLLPKMNALIKTVNR